MYTLQLFRKTPNVAIFGQISRARGRNGAIRTHTPLARNTEEKYESYSTPTNQRPPTPHQHMRHLYKLSQKLNINLITLKTCGNWKRSKSHNE